MNKVFISYSHKDEQYKDDLDERLAILKRNGHIDVWHDRKITAGQEWKNQISQNLADSNIIIFLVSPSFLASDYCYDVEGKAALEMHKAGKAILIPVLVRPCDWHETPFSTFQALPKDAKPITLWDQADLAWMNVVQGLRDSIENLKQSVQMVFPEIDDQSPNVTSSFLDWIDDTEIVLTHRNVDKVKLHEIYVSPDLEKVDESKKSKVEILTSNEILKPGMYLIYGEEQQGKTTLLKNTYKELLKAGKYPLYVNARNVKRSNLAEAFRLDFEVQYKNFKLEEFLTTDNKVLLVDDLSELNLNTIFRGKFLKNICEDFKHVVVLANSSFSFVAPEINEISGFDSFGLLNLGHEKRAEIIEKWVSLGNEECISEEELFKRCDEIKARLDPIVRKNIVPAKPIYLLMLLQMFEAYTQQNLELTSYGHCYQELIYQAFRNADIHPKEVNQYLNVLTELAWKIHLNKDGLNAAGLDDFFDEYEKKYLGVDRKTVLQKLQKNSILRESSFKIHFKYPYLFYFFVAKKIADYYLEDSSVKDEIANLLGNFHREDYANILVFVTHHTKDSWILAEIQNTLKLLFDDQEKASLENDQLKFISDFILSIPDLIMEQREIRGERTKHNRQLDKYEQDIDQDENVEEFESVEIFANINKTFKGMEIAGQIIRNRHASMTRNSLYSLAVEGTSTGLRFLNYFIAISDIAKSEVIKFIENKLRENPKLENEEIQAHAKNVFVHLTYGVINGVIRKIASAIGSQEAAEIYKQMEKDNPSPAIVLLNQAIELQFNKVLKVEEIEKTSTKLKSNPVCTRILKEIVIQHTYMFPVGYKEKQQLCEILSISIQGQRAMDLQKIGKG